METNIANNARKRFAEKYDLRMNAKRKVNNRLMGDLFTNRLTVEEFEAYTGIMFSHDMEGKMKNVLSISTNCKANPYCMARYQNGVGICASCFAQATTARYKHVNENTALNTEILTKELIPDEVMPRITNDICRIESFGDLNNVIQARNYLRLIKANPDVQFGWWTKNPNFAHLALQEECKGRVPENVHIILSSLLLNTETKINPKYAYFVNKVFTVYTLEWLHANNINEDKFINCGARSCNNCRRCYRSFDDNQLFKRNNDVRNGVEYVKELLKSDAKKKERNHEEN